MAKHLVHDKSRDPGAEEPSRSGKSEARRPERADLADPADTPGGGSPERLLMRLQETHGNAFVQRLIQRRDRPPLEQPLQTEPARTDWSRVSSVAIDVTTRGIESWKTLVGFEGVTINGPVASGGRLRELGEPMLSFVLVRMLTAGIRVGIVSAFSGAIGRAWDDWQSSVTVPGLPWYPRFAAFPGPVAPPTPNVPTPFSLLTSKRITAGAVAAAIQRDLGSEKEPGQDEAVNGFAAWFAGESNRMIQTTTIKNVFGEGPVPSFSPPLIPVGPVVGGVATGEPGFLRGAIPPPRLAR